MSSCVLFSICITSYNRVNELKRTLESIDSKKYMNSIEIIVSEDKSPRKEEIEQVVLNYAKKSAYKVCFNSNILNLGYDRNLGKLISLANGKYILFMSDDDSFISGTLDKYFDEVIGCNDCCLAFQPFYFPDKKEYSRKYNNTFFIKPSMLNAGEYLYNSILFSGLTFKKECIQSLKSDAFLNTYYFQVYMFLCVLYINGAYYLDLPLISCNGDGENGYGLSESSIKNENLVNRNSVFSNLEFNKGLVKVISLFDDEYKTNVKSVFEKEYSIRTYPGLCRAKRQGTEIYTKYVNEVEAIGLKLSLIYKIYKVMLCLLGPKLSDFLIYIPKNTLICIRKYILRK